MKQQKITFVLDPRLVLSINGDKGIDPFKVVAETIKKVLSVPDITVLNKHFDRVIVSVAVEDELSDNDATKILDAISSAIGVEDRSKMSLIFESPDDEAHEQPGSVFDDSSEEPVVQKSEDVADKKSASEKIAELVGMDELKKVTEEIGKVAEFYKDKNKLREILLGMTYLISMNSGNGRSTVSSLISEYISEVLGSKKVKIDEIALEFSSDRDGAEKLHHAIRNITSYSSNPNYLAVNVIHLDSVQNKLNSTDWQKVIGAIQDTTPNALFIFMVPFIEDMALADIHSKIDDMLPNKVIRIPPFTNNMYIKLFEKRLSEYDMSLSTDAHDAILQKLLEEKSDGCFYGVNTVHKICNELLYYKSMSSDELNRTAITRGDVEALLTEKSTSGEPSIQKLENLVSLGQVKQKVREILATIKLKREMGDKKGASMHMMFSGAPGTGKTVVARLVGKIFKEECLLTKGDFYEVSRKDLVGMYVGHTAPKTAEVCKSAYGSVLFIDEAYSLAAGDERDFGHEAISTLIAEMENNRENFVVIFAGYEHELQKLFDMNPGLRDRIPYHISFTNYSREELLEIFYMNIPENFTYDEGFKSTADEYFKNLPDDVLNDKNFSNGRYVRNLTERIFSKAALRLAMDADAERGVLTRNDFTLAISDPEFDKINEKRPVKRTIGFSAQ